MPNVLFALASGGKPTLGVTSRLDGGDYRNMDVTFPPLSKWWGQHVQEDQLAQRRSLCQALRMDDPLHATIEEFAAEGYTHIACHCPRCRMTRLRTMSWLPKISMGLTLAQLSARLRCAKCGGPLHSVRPWRQEDVLGKPQGRRG